MHKGMERKKQRLVIDVDERDLTLPLLVVKTEEECESHFIQQDPYKVYAEGFCDERLVPVTAQPFREPIMILAEGLGGRSMGGEECTLNSREGLLSRLPRKLDPVGFEARKYILQNDLGDIDSFAYRAAYYPNRVRIPNNKELVPIQLYRVTRRVTNEE